MNIGFYLISELCSASVRTCGNRVVRRNDSHLHDRALRIDPQQEFLSRLKKRAAEDTLTIPKIYDEELTRSINEHSVEICQYLPSFSSIKSTLYRHRQRYQKLKSMSSDCKTSKWTSSSPRKRSLTHDMNNDDEKRRKYSSFLTPYNVFLVQNYMFMLVYASVIFSLQQHM